jgi:hypothetical protein
VQYFLDNLMDQKPDQAATFSAIGEVSVHVIFSRLVLSQLSGP